MKKIIALVLTVTLVSIAVAQVQRGNGTPKTSLTKKAAPNTASLQNSKEQAEKKDKMRRKQMMHALGLTKIQKGKLKQMHQASKSKMNEIKNDPSLSETDKKAKLKDIRKEQQNNTEALLTDEQKVKFKEMKKKNHQQKKEAAAATPQ
jgi:periplasmic protein CpxP/Spy